MRGRKRKPTALHVLNGNPGKRRLPANEPVPVGEVVMPKWLSKGGVKVWVECAPGLMASGVLTVADVPAFAMTCELDAEYRANPAEMSVGRLGTLKSLWSEFGMTPSSRSKVSVKKDQPMDKRRKFGLA